MLCVHVNLRLGSYAFIVSCSAIQLVSVANKLVSLSLSNNYLSKLNTLNAIGMASVITP